VGDPKKPDPKKEDPKAAQAAARPSAIDKINDWGVYAAGAGKAKACYVLAEPKERAPKPSSATRATSSSPSDPARACATRSPW
jgi:hypothetical protein